MTRPGGRATLFVVRNRFVKEPAGAVTVPGIGVGGGGGAPPRVGVSVAGVVEPAAAALAAERRTDDHLQVMRDALAQMESSEFGQASWQSADRSFHDAVLAASPARAAPPPGPVVAQP